MTASWLVLHQQQSNAHTKHNGMTHKIEVFRLGDDMMQATNIVLGWSVCVCVWMTGCGCFRLCTAIWVFDGRLNREQVLIDSNLVRVTICSYLDHKTHTI